MVYKADLAGVALKPQESRVIAAWLLGRYGIVNDESWVELIYANNEVLIKGRSTLRRQSNLLRSRLRLLEGSELVVIADGSFRETAQMCLAAAIKHSRLLGDFLDIKLRNELEKLNWEINAYHWREFLEECHHRDPEMTEWTVNTINRIQTSVFSLLMEAGVLKKEKDYVIQKIEYENTVIQTLESSGESAVLRCMRFMS